ncbi:MAG: rhodanese-related sulfurtransferase [Rickettsiaceae bacterium]|nr:rhodanese-related sulfurtransferase [Rickettsiaceae bacterium]
MESKEKIAVLSFYSFTNISEPEYLIPKLLHTAKRKYIRGTIIVAEEGFNGSISGDEQNLNLLLEQLKKDSRATNINIKVNYCDKHPFSKIKVKLKNEIVAMKAGNIDAANNAGIYIAPKDWDEFISRDDVILIDTRNNYEILAGTFKGAIDPQTETFRDFPEWAQKNKETLKDKKIAMCCTGGIRCEKSTAYMKELGLTDVYHLEGGILQYLEDTKNANNKWQGECFVFDDRGAVSDDLLPAEGYWVEENTTAKKVAIENNKI